MKKLRFKKGKSGEGTINISIRYIINLEKRLSELADRLKDVNDRIDKIHESIKDN